MLGSLLCKVNMSTMSNQVESNAPLPPPVFIPDELIDEILSFLDVETILQLKCVSKSWKNLILDPTFVQKHLKKSLQNPHIILTPPYQNYPIKSVHSFPVRHLLKKSSIVTRYQSYRDSKYKIISSCNGLLCLLLNSPKKKDHYRFCLCNPATRKISAEFGTLDTPSHFWEFRTLDSSVEFTFGCDILTGTYKIVSLFAKRNAVRVLSLGDNCWRNIIGFPLIPLTSKYNNSVHLSGTVSWLALRDHVERFVIVSLDLSTETLAQFLLPFGLYEVLNDGWLSGWADNQPTLQVLMDHLCISHDFERTGFVIWQMKEFGVQESWTQLFRIDYFNLEMHDKIKRYHNLFLLPLYLSKNGDTLVLTYEYGGITIIYNQRDNRVVGRIRALS